MQGGHHLVQQSVVSAATKIDFLNLVQNTRYFIYYQLVNGTNAQYLTMLTSFDNGANWESTNYQGGIQSWAAYNSATITNTNSNTFFYISDLSSNTRHAEGEIHISIGQYTSFFGEGITLVGAGSKLVDMQGYMATSSVVNALRIVATSGSLTGRCSLYKVI